MSGYYPTRQRVTIIHPAQALQAQAAQAARAAAAREIAEHAAQQLEQERQASLRAQFIAEVNQPGRVWRYSGVDRAELAHIQEQYKRQGLTNVAPPPVPNNSPTNLQLSREKELRQMDKQQKAKRMAQVMALYGLDADNPRHMQEVGDELEYSATTLHEGQDSAAEAAIQRAAGRLGVRSPMPATERDTRTPMEKYADSLSPKERMRLHNWQQYKGSEDHAQEQEAQLRARYVNEVQQRAVDHGRGNQLDDREAQRIARHYQGLGLKDTSLSRDDLGQDDDTLLSDAADRINGIPGGQTYRPDFGYPEDRREQGNRAAWLGGANAGRGGRQ